MTLSTQMTALWHTSPYSNLKGPLRSSQGTPKCRRQVKAINRIAMIIALHSLPDPTSTKTKNPSNQGPAEAALSPLVFCSSPARLSVSGQQWSGQSMVTTQRISGGFSVQQFTSSRPCKLLSVSTLVSHRRTGNCLSPLCLRRPSLSCVYSDGTCRSLHLLRASSSSASGYTVITPEMTFTAHGTVPNETRCVRRRMDPSRGPKLL